jgi:hypothetical protein
LFLARVPCELLESFKRYVAEHNSTLTDLNEVYFRCLSSGQSIVNASIVSRLSGTLVMDVSIQDHKKHLEDKYTRYIERDKL